QKRVVDSSDLSPARKTGQGACAGGLSGLRLVGNAQTLPSPQESKDISCPSLVDTNGPAQCRHRASDNRQTRDPASQNNYTDTRTTNAACSPGHADPGSPRS